jgi:hypothetical protein
MQSDPALIGAFRKQVRMVLASGNADAFLGLWIALKDQDGVNQDDLVDALKEEGGTLPV